MKTKLQRMKLLENGEKPYNGIVDCVIKTSMREGIKGFYVGYLIFFLRNYPHGVMTVLLLEWFNDFYKKFKDNH